MREMNEGETPGIGHNRPPPFRVKVVEDYRPRVSSFADAAGAWLDKGEIENNQQAEKLNDYVNGCRKLFGKIEKDRQKDKAPNISEGKLIDKTYNTMTLALTKAAERVKPLLTRWALKKADIQRELQRKAMTAAEAEQLKAQKLRDEAIGRHDVMGETEAEDRQKAAKKTVAEAARTITTGQVASSSGGGRTAALRTYYIAKIKKPKMVMLWILNNDPDQMMSFLALASNAAKRADSTLEIPGVEFIKDRRI